MTATAPAADTEPRDPRLIGGEEILFKTEKHWLAPLTDSWMAILMIIGALVVAWLQTDQTTGIMGFANRILNLLQLGLFLGGLGWIAYNIVAWRSAHYDLTNQRILFEDGLLRRRSADTLLTSISDVRMRQSAVGRSLGYGDIQILSQSGDAGADTFTSVRKADELKRRVLEQKIALSSAGGAASGTVPAAAGATPPAAQSAQAETLATLTSLAALRDSGAITAAEYEAKKNEILARI